MSALLELRLALTSRGLEKSRLSDQVARSRLTVFKIYNGYWYFDSRTIEGLRHDVWSVLQKRRLDWIASIPYGKNYTFCEQE